MRTQEIPACPGAVAIAAIVDCMVILFLTVLGAPNERFSTSALPDG